MLDNGGGGETGRGAERGREGQEARGGAGRMAWGPVGLLLRRGPWRAPE